MAAGASLLVSNQDSRASRARLPPRVRGPRAGRRPAARRGAGLPAGGQRLPCGRAELRIM